MLSNAVPSATLRGAATDPARVSPKLPRGTLIDGRYRVEAVLGQGGSGYVLAARHHEKDERVAIKLPYPGQSAQRLRERLEHEARTTAKIRSEHAVRILEVVTAGPHAPYIVMERLLGETLADRLARKGALPVREVVDCVLQACEVVGEAHRLRIVHRDLKPSNLFLSTKSGRRPFVKVLDFGICRTDEAVSHGSPRSHALLASPAYAPPEQLRLSSEVDHRADIWALGVILYECMTGRLPFGGGSLPEVCTRVLCGRPLSPRRWRNEIPPWLARATLHCLEKDPARRYPKLEELVSALRRFAPSAAHRCALYLRSLADDPTTGSARGRSGPPGGQG